MFYFDPILLLLKSRPYQLHKFFLLRVLVFLWEETLELMVIAGNDIICLGNNLMPYRENLIPESIETIISLVDEGKIPSDRIEESYRRILNMKSMIA